MKQVFEAKIRIPFHLADPAGILFFGNFFSLAHMVYENWICEKVGKWENWFENGRWVAPIKKSSAEYFKPLKAGSAVTIKIFMVSVTESSFTSASEFHTEAGLHARLETIQVFCDRKTFSKIPVPLEVRGFIS